MHDLHFAVIGCHLPQPGLGRHKQKRPRHGGLVSPSEHRLLEVFKVSRKHLRENRDVPGVLPPRLGNGLRNWILGKSLVWLGRGLPFGQTKPDLQAIRNGLIRMA